MKPLILITNDDGVGSRGLQHLTHVAESYGEIVVVASSYNASGLSTSITTSRPLRIHSISQKEGVSIYSCDGTPADCVKIGLEHLCPRRPTLVLSGINHGSNAAINIIYSGTMGATIEACLNGCQAIGFSLLNHSAAADFEACTPTIRHVLSHVMRHPLPDYTALNVNIPKLPAEQIKGIRVCRQAKAAWVDSLEKRTDPIGRPYWWMTGKFVCDNPPADSDVYLLDNGYATVVPIRPDLTAFQHLQELKEIEI